MSTFKPIQVGIHHVLSLLVTGVFLTTPALEVRADNAVDDTDLLFECVQTTYSQNASGEQSVQFSVVNNENLSQTQESSDFNLGGEPQAATLEAPGNDVAKTVDEQNTTTKPQTASKAKAKPIEKIVPQPAENNVVVRTPSPEKAPTKPQVGTFSSAEEQPDEETLENVGPFQIYRESEELSVVTRRSMLMRTKYNLIRTAIVDPSICDIVQFTPREISIIGRAIGSTHVTFWFEDGTFKPITFVVKTLPDPTLRDRRAEQFALLEEHISEMFPNSKVKLILLANKLIIRGQVRNAEEASEILRILREDTENYSSSSRNNTAVSLQEETGLPNTSGLIIVNQLRIPGVQQVSLKVKLADLSRSNGTSSGVDFQVNIDGGKAVVSSLMGAFTGGGGLLTYSSSDVKIGLDYLVGQGVVRQMSESTLVTMSGTSASLSTGGEIPVPTITGVDGASAVSTSFRPYGTVINFLPIVMDKDLIRLKISSEFSSLSDEGNEISGVPNLESRTLDSDVQMREGQTFALGTTLEDNYSASNQSNIPIFSNFLGHKSKSRGEREMVILVSPELVCPMEPDEVPPLPGFDVTEPTNVQFHVLGRLEGTPTRDYRSTVWPSLRNRYLSGGSAIISGPYGH